MAVQVNIHEAKTHLSKLIEQVEHGEEVVIARNGTPVVKLIPEAPKRSERTGLGAWKGKVDLSRFDEADEEIAREFGAID